MSDAPAISVAMCTYNGAAYLQQQLDSIAAQSRLPKEVIVCDDRSTDDTLAILKRFAETARFPVRVTVNDQQLGPTKNFEKAIQLCQGPIIALSDQDDIWKPEKLERIIGVFDGSPQTDAVFSDADLVNEKGRPLGFRLWTVYFRKTDQVEFSAGRTTDVLLRHNVATGATLAFRASFRDLIVPIPPQWVHDAWILFLIAACGKVTSLPEPLIQYRRHPQQRIGLPPPGRWLRFRRRRDFYANVAVYYELLRDRLAAFSSRPRNPQLLAKIQNKIDHYNFRATLPQQLWRRAPLVLREWSGGGYSRHSNSWKSVVKDLCLWIDRRPPAA